MISHRPGTSLFTLTVGILCTSFLTAACWDEEQQAIDDDLACSNVPSAALLFVHGSGLTPATWQPMIDHFLAAGYPADFLLAADLLPRDGDNVAAAENTISSAVRILQENSDTYFSRHGCAHSGPEKIDIVAHSMGAISARWYASFVNPDDVRTIVTIAGANHGTDMLCGRPGPGDKQLCPAFSDSTDPEDVQKKLNGTAEAPVDETPYGLGNDSPDITPIRPIDDRRIVYISIRLDPDRWIVPADSAILDGAGGKPVNTANFPSLLESSPGNYIFVKQISHDDLPSNAELIRFVKQLLD